MTFKEKFLQRQREYQEFRLKLNRQEFDWLTKHQITWAFADFMRPAVKMFIWWLVIAYVIYPALVIPVAQEMQKQLPEICKTVKY